MGTQFVNIRGDNPHQLFSALSLAGLSADAAILMKLKLDDASGIKLAEFSIEPANSENYNIRAYGKFWFDVPKEIIDKLKGIEENIIMALGRISPRDITIKEEPNPFMGITRRTSLILPSESLPHPKYASESSLILSRAFTVLDLSGSKKPDKNRYYTNLIEYIKSELYVLLVRILEREFGPPGATIDIN